MVTATPRFLKGQEEHICAHLPFEDVEIEQSLPARFERQVELYPGRVALHSKSEVFTYQQLNRHANRLARTISDTFKTAEEPVALLFDHGCSVLLAKLAVLKSGNFYVVLDPAYPRDRLNYMLKDSTARVIVTDRINQRLAEELSDQKAKIIDIGYLDRGISTKNLTRHPSPDSLALLLYTSGSTGRPKAVMHTHKNVLVEIRNLTNNWRISHLDRMLLYTSCSFANSVRTIYIGLLNGGAIYPYDTKREGFEGLTDWLTSNRITVWRSVPTTFRYFMSLLSEKKSFPDVRILSLGGEPVLSRDVDYFNKFFSPHCILVCAIGPTECFGVRSAFLSHGSGFEESTVPVGYAMRDKEVSIIDENGQSVASGVVGEIAVKSRYLARGYWCKPELTRAVFCNCPSDPEARIYRTGDLGIMSEDGCLRHVGRKDFQVKIRGFRVEVLEIEKALRELDGVEDALVHGRKGPSGEMQLVAYFVATSPSAVTATDLRRTLANGLPDYMVPSLFVSIDAIPTTPTGKVDRRALPNPDSKRPELGSPYVDGRTPAERKLCQIWANALGLEKVGVHDPFLELGGDSLLATRIVTEVGTAFGVRFPIQALLVSPTVEDMTAVLEQFLENRIAQALDGETSSGQTHEVKGNLNDSVEASDSNSSPNNS